MIMAEKISAGLFTDWKDGQKVDAKTYKEEREILRVGVNDTWDRFIYEESELQTLKDDFATLDAVEAHEQTMLERKKAITLQVGETIVNSLRRTPLNVGRIDGATEVTVDNRGVLFLSSPYIKNETNGTYQYFARDSKGKVLKLAQGEYLENGKKYKEWETDVDNLHKMPDLSSATLSGYTTGKRIQFTLNLATTTPSVYLSKYDGSIIQERPTTDHQDDTWVYDNSIPRFFIYVANSDTGWGDGYSPTVDEVKSYLLGWRMNTGTFGTPYDGTGTKTWIPIGDSDNTRSTTTLPTKESNTVEEGSIHPYKLHYKLATPYFEDVQIEGQVVLDEGDNTVTLGSGIVVREKVSLNAGSTHMFTSDLSTPLEYENELITDFYKNYFKDNQWEVQVQSVEGGTSYHGKSRGRIENGLVDKEAHYSVTYLAQPSIITTGLTSVDVEVYENMKSTLDDHAKKLSELAKQSGSMGHYLTSLLGMGGEMKVMETASGTTIRWDNGIQMCIANKEYTGITSDVYGNIYRVVLPSEPYPAEFKELFFATCDWNWTSNWWGSINSSDSTLKTHYEPVIFSGAAISSATSNMTMFAIGRWK